MNNNTSLKIFHTFSVHVNAYQVLTVFYENDFLVFWKQAIEQGRPVLILGAGSNVLFLEHYSGLILLNRIKGIYVRENKDFWYLHVGAGELWHGLVLYSLDKNMPGLENLALIPGYVGSAPIHNIGAYGVELQSFCDYVDVLHLRDGEKIRFNVNDCKFSYRNSVFKNEFNKYYVIIAVGLKLSKRWIPIVDYEGLDHLDIKQVTPRKIFNTICDIRYRKFPDSKFFGSAGSFFKNPFVNISVVNKLLKSFPKLPFYIKSDSEVKLIAGWLIDQCKLRGYSLGGASVYIKTPAILVNNKQATSDEIVMLASYVRNVVGDKFNIWLEPEVRFIGAKGEIDSLNVLL